MRPAALSNPSPDAAPDPFGTQFVNRVLTQALKPGIFSIVYGPTKVAP